MPPDLNSLPPSRSTSSSPLQSRNNLAALASEHTTGTSSSTSNVAARSPSRRSSSVSLAAAATINAADISRRSSTTSAANRPSPHTGRVHERRRSTVAMNLNLTDPTMPGPGELSSSDRRASIGNSLAFRTASPTTSNSFGAGSPIVATGDPHHHRTPSLGELHQELEQEQEAQVNRLLLMIRQQQAQLQQLQHLQQQNQQSGGGTAVIDDSTPTSERSVSFPALPPLPTPSHRSSINLPHGHGVRRGSNQTSPALGSQAEFADLGALGGEAALGRRGSRDETAFYQAETAALNRENQMLRMRIRELERQISDLTTARPRTPATSSNLASSSSNADDITPSSSEAEPSAAEAEKV